MDGHWKTEFFEIGHFQTGYNIFLICIFSAIECVRTNHLKV